MLKQTIRAYNKGFTLIELLIGIGILSTLLVVSVPLYSKYKVRGKVAAMVGSATAAQLAVVNDFYEQGLTLNYTNFPTNTEPFTIPKSDFISSISVEQGWVRIIGNPDNLGGREINLVFQPTVNNNQITWTCYVSSEYFDLAPPECRNTGCAVYTWSDWQSIDSGTTWLYNAAPANVESTWANYCVDYTWYFGCSCFNATDTNLVKYDVQHTVIDNVDNGWGWTYLIVNHDCRQATRIKTNDAAACSSCPPDTICSDIFEEVTP